MSILSVYWSTVLIAPGVNEEVGSALLKVQLWNDLGPCLCFLERLCLNAGGGTEGVVGFGASRNAPIVGKSKGDNLWAWMARVRVQRGASVGGALRNAWKLSGSSRRHMADNPPHPLTVPSPSTPISPSPSSLSSKPARVGFTRVNLCSSCFTKKEVCFGSNDGQARPHCLWWLLLRIYKVCLTSFLFLKCHLKTFLAMVAFRTLTDASWGWHSTFFCCC